MATQQRNRQKEGAGGTGKSQALVVQRKQKKKPFFGEI